ncbi:MAG: TraR/DksA C4-type zinc finger protein [Patescibacteria group bacterium]
MTKSKAKVQSIRFPQSVLTPVADFLTKQLHLLERRKKNIEDTDPFSDESRVVGNAASDTEAEEQFGHTMSSALKEQIDRRIIQTRKALSRIKVGKYGICENCGKMIDTDRLMVYPDAVRCIDCEKKTSK